MRLIFRGLKVIEIGEVGVLTSSLLKEKKLILGFKFVGGKGRFKYLFMFFILNYKKVIE